MTLPDDDFESTSLRDAVATLDRAYVSTQNDLIRAMEKAEWAETQARAARDVVDRVSKAEQKLDALHRMTIQLLVRLVWAGAIIVALLVALVLSVVAR